MIAVCSVSSRPSVQKGPKGAQHWARDVYHLADDGSSTTLCGRSREDWLTIGTIERLDVHCCVLCRRKATEKDNGL